MHALPECLCVRIIIYLWNYTYISNNAWNNCVCAKWFMVVNIICGCEHACNACTTRYAASRSFRSNDAQKGNRRKPPQKRFCFTIIFTRTDMNECTQVTFIFHLKLKAFFLFWMKWLQSHFWPPLNRKCWLSSFRKEKTSFYFFGAWRDQRSNYAVGAQVKFNNNFKEIDST